jgi:serine/threonine protein kinase
VRAIASREIAHGGIHPGNILIEPDGRARLADFAISRAALLGAVQSPYPITAVRYLPPEQWRGQPPTARSDIYALGVVVTMLDSRSEPFNAADLSQVQVQVLAGLRSACPVISAAIHPDPARRYPEIDAFRDRLVSRVRPQAAPTPSPAPTSSPDPKPTPSPTPTPTPNPSPSPQVRSPPPPRTPVAPPEDARRAEPRMAPPGGKLTRVFDLKGQRDLLEKSPPEPWILPAVGQAQQRPLQLVNGGTTGLELLVQCAGEGVSASPHHLVIGAGAMASVIVSAAANSAPFANLIFRWKQASEEKMIVVRIVRSGS